MPRLPAVPAPPPPSKAPADDEVLLVLRVFAGLLSATNAVATQFIDRYHGTPLSGDLYWQLTDEAYDAVKATQWTAQAAGLQLWKVLPPSPSYLTTVGNLLRSLADDLDRVNLSDSEEPDATPAPSTKGKRGGSQL